jgi:hypothetical protein
VVNSAASGAVQIDEAGRRNIIWYAGKVVGAAFKSGVPQVPTDTVKLVLSSETAKIHAFSMSPTEVRARTCVRCGQPILT